MLLMNWIFCPFVSRSWKRQVLASRTKSRASSSVTSLIMSVPDFWCVSVGIGEVSLSHQPLYRQLLALPSAAKQQIKGSDFRRAPCAALFLRTGYGFVSVVTWCCFTVASFLCPSFLQRCVSLARCQTRLTPGTKITRAVVSHLAALPLKQFPALHWPLSFISAVICVAAGWAGSRNKLQFFLLTALLLWLTSGRKYRDDASQHSV